MLKYYRVWEGINTPTFGSEPKPQFHTYLSFKDAIMMPECGCSMCDECARDSLINSDKNECPDCGEANNSPDDLIPWRQLRDKVITSFPCTKERVFRLIRI